METRHEEDWNKPPEPEVRRAKTAMEDELLIKLGVKRENIEFHPLIKHQRIDRASTVLSLKYQKIKPPYREEPLWIRNAWKCNNVAMRQMSDIARKGPRNVSLDAVTRARGKRVPFPAGDPEYHKKRAARFKKLTELLSEWRGYQQLAFVSQGEEQLDFGRLNSFRRASTSTSTSVSTTSQICKISRERSSSFTAPLRIRSAKTRVRTTPQKWMNMKREMLVNLKAAKLKIDKDIPRSEVRIYLTATPDMAEEREFLAEVACPELRRYCEKLGMNCHVVDLRTGMDKLGNDIMTFKMCEVEVEKCRRLSVGPNFVCLVGEQLDNDLPGFMSKEELEQIRDVVIKQRIEGVELLDEYYRLDTNRLSPLYELAREDLQNLPDSEEAEVKLKEVLTDAMDILREEGKFGRRTKDFYKWSICAKEVETGLYGCREPGNQLLCFMRDSSVEHHEKGFSNLLTIITRCFENNGCEGNIVPIAKGRKTLNYMRNICNVFLAHVMTMIEKNLDLQQFYIADHVSGTADLIQHVNHQKLLNKSYTIQTNEQLFEEIRDILMNPAFKKTAVICGDKGSGKSSFVAHIAECSVTWIPKVNTIIRFIGRSLRTSSLYHTLISTCKQIAFLYTLSVRFPPLATLVDIIKIFRTLLKQASEDEDVGPLVIILDGLENISDLEPHHVWALMEDLPLNVSLVLTIDRAHPYLKLLKASPQPGQFFTIQGVVGDERKNTIDKILKAAGKTVTSDQLNMVLKQTGYEETPLTLTVVGVIAAQWPSHTLPEQFRVDSATEAFERLIEDVEENIGSAFTKYVLSLLATSRYGLADSELLHLVLSESDLLNELQSEITDLSVLEGYPYQAQLCRIFMWMDPFLEERKVEGETLKKIGHASLKSAIQKRYLEEEFERLMHKQLASFFQYTRRGLLFTAKQITEKKGLALISQNWRTLRSVPYHLSRSSSDVPNTLKTLKETVLLNFTWIINEIYSGYLNDFLFDLKAIVELLQVDEDIFLVRRLLLNLRHVLEENPTALASIVSQFPSHHSHYFNQFIEQSKEWMKQVHTTILIPSPNCGFFSGSFFYGNVTRHSEQMLPSQDGLYLVSMMSGKFQTIELGTGECLASVEAVLQRPYVWGKYRVTGLMDNALKTWDILGGKLLRKVPLGIGKVSWLHVFDDGTAYFASDKHIKRLHAVTGTPSCVINAQQQIRDAAMSHRMKPTICTLHVHSDWCVRIWETSDPENFETIPLEEKSLSSRCDAFHMTNDGKYAVVLYEKEAVILSILDQEVECILAVGDEDIHLIMFTRSHDHVFLASETGKIRGNLLNSGTQLFSASVFGESAKKSAGKVTAMTTSEDDHFLMVGISTGMVVVMNIPSGQTIHHFSSHTEKIIQLFYMTDHIHFQHLISLSKDGTAKLWNLQNILRSAREKLFEIMWDDDLIKEESEKIDLPSYYKLYEAKGKSKMFLNGPDVSAFYNKTDENIFGGHSTEQPGGNWEQSGNLQDCLQVIASNTAAGRGDIILTYTGERKIAWWDVKREKLLSVRTVAPGGRFHRLRTVFFDQAACLITRDTAEKETISIVYGTGKKKTVLQREKVLRCDISADSKKMATVIVMRQGFLLTIVDLNTEEEQKFVLHLGDITGTVSMEKARVTLSKDLTVVLGFLKVEDRTIIISWNVADSDSRSSEGGSSEGEERRLRTKSSHSSGADSSKEETISFQNITELNIKVTKSRFYNEQEVLFGTRDGDIFILDSFTLKVIKLFSKEGIVACKSTKSTHTKPHRSAVRSMYFTSDYTHLLTSEASRVCVWNMQRKAMVYSPATGDKMINAVLSRDGCFTVAGLATGVVRMWANYQRKLLYSFRIPTTLHHVALTPDNARIIALVDENNGKRVVVFEIKNIDDYLLDKGDDDL
ncbi:NACHT domain- and WD repeat-containing protein 1-like [Haliotis asinina]|uniref:NACHT domain- and WD repeat-containing protein 1-like n=1 Tax=Haliotis asinina TaxID=109174 RepID=UPI003531D630